MMLQLSPEIIRQYSSVFIVNLSVLTTGMSVGWSSPMLVKLADPLQTPLSRPITENEASWIVSLGYLISSFSNVIGSFLLDKIGRKYSVLACAVPKLSMAIFLIFVTEVWMVIFARAFMLLNDCFLFCVVPVYAAEIASKTQRGSLGTFLQLFSSLGVVITLSVGPFVSYYTYSYILLAMVVITTIPVLILPESPFFQYSQGKTDEALKTLTEIRGSETQAKLELEDYEKSAENSIKISKVELLKNKIFLKSLLLCFLLYGGSQLVGFNAVSFYLQTILISTKTNVAPEIASVIIGVIQTMGSLSVTLLTAIFERKRILILSLSGMFIGMEGMWLMSGRRYPSTLNKDN
ncbi:facilitated trehalose transporter Tret1 isoform X2 [Pieris rapae]|uniref:facilitated trehalose transporter Tret1 isoform X2 n=1 Tax=Pieris rapae TaxID=64459 RepID=UPI001E27E693|nr:facilitated trehalose transporter Tret1 isoform X2 [Pieris rapae]